MAYNKIDVTGVRWFKSSKSLADGDNCVEVAMVDGMVAVRNSRHPDAEPLILTNAEWGAFLHGVKRHEFDV